MFFGKKVTGPAEWLLVCLGNYGKQYENTRHNIGFMAAERLIDKQGLRCNRLRFRALTELIEFGGARVLLMMPQTYMNLSGEAVGEAARFYKIPSDHVLVIYDDVSLPLGKLRIRDKGSAGGHNGIKNIIAHLGTDVFPRVKVGVGAPSHPDYDMVDWVIGSFSAQEKKITVLGVSVTVAMVLTAPIAGLVQTYVLDALSLGYLQTLVFAAIVLIVVYAMNAAAKAAFKKDLGVYFPVIALNSAVLGLAVNNAADALSLGESILTALGAGLGFWLALAAFAAVRSKIRERYVPKAWRGLPIYLLTAAILSMALLAF